MTVLLATAYLPPVQYYSKLFSHSAALIEHYEHFSKQTYRNRCNIYGANGLLSLSIPLQKRGERTLTKDVKISYDDPWQKLHWRSLQSAYRRSPFFEFYEDDFAPFYENKKFDFLIDFNEALLHVTLQLLGKKTELKNTSLYQKEYADATDFRTIISPNKSYTADIAFILKPYMQVFENKYGFIPNLSIVDLLFNQGTSAIDFI